MHCVVGIPGPVQRPLPEKSKIIWVNLVLAGLARQAAIFGLRTIIDLYCTMHTLKVWYDRSIFSNL